MPHPGENDVNHSNSWHCYLNFVHCMPLKKSSDIVNCLCCQENSQKLSGGIFFRR